MSIIASGCRGDYRWIITELEMIQLLTLCPSIILNKYIAVTSADSGMLALNEQEIAKGWKSQGGIAYSPCISSIKELPLAYLEESSYHEWFIFAAPSNLGQLSNQNVFVDPLYDGIVVPFVNYPGFKLHDDKSQDLQNLFWEQLERVRPQSYISDGEYFCTFVSSNNELFSIVHSALIGEITE